MSFLGIYKAVYSYTPQSDQELAIEENDILYLIERSDVDDWWTVKKRIVGADVDEPAGLVPSNYIENADIIGTALSLYDYEKQTDEELTFKEGDQFEVYDDKDPDWILVSKNKQEFGFVPSNYIEVRKGTASAAPPAQIPSAILPPPTHPSLATSKVQAESQTFQPPPQRNDRVQQEEDDQEEDDQPPLPSVPTPSTQDDYDDYRSSRRDSTRQSSYNDHRDEVDAPPPKPARPGLSATSSGRDSYRDPEPPRNQEEEDDGELYTWQVSEVDGRKKKKAMLAIGNSTVYFSPDSVNSGTPQQWKVKDLISYSNEKKHVFLEFRNPLYSLEIHAGSKDVAAQIISILSELKGSSSNTLLKEVKNASTSKGSSTKKTGKILYDFDAQGDDELTVREGDSVYIINDKKSKDWWMVENIKNGRSGVVPSQFVEPVKESTSFASKFKLSRSKSKDNLKSSSPTKKQQKEPDSSPSKKLSGPKASRVRTWEDRSGTFKVDAEFLGVVEGKVHLHKTNGVKIAVAAPKLSLIDLEYVERVTGMSLESYKVTAAKSKGKTSESDKERRDRKERERKRRERDEKAHEQDERERQRERQRDRDERERDRQRDKEERERDRQRDQEERDFLRKELDEAKRLAAEAKRVAQDIPPQQPARPASTSSSRNRNRSDSLPSKPAYDWFEFFLEAGVDVNQCQRYTSNFQNEQIDPSIIESIDATILRTLGLREGDIIRVTRYLDQKFNRQPKESSSNGGLFSEPSGALKVNRTGSASQVGNSLPSPTKTRPDDDAWTVKPAVNNEQKTDNNISSLQTQQFTGSMQDLVNLKPLQPTATASSIKSVPQTYAPIASKPLEPIKTGASVLPQKTGEITAQATGAVPLDPFKTGGGNILPLTTGGAYVYLPIQQTGAILQSNGLIPLQRTGGLTPAFTGGLVPLQRTGGLNPTLTGGLVPLQKTGPLNAGLTGGFPTFGPVNTLPPATTFSALPGTLTGGLPASLTGGLPAQSFSTFQPTGGLSQTSFGVPQTSFGAQPAAGFPQTSFGGQATGGFPQTTFGAQATGGFPQTTFGGQPTGVPQTTVSAQASGFPTTSFGPQSTGFAQQPLGFNSLPNLFNQPQATGFSQQQPTGFNQPQIFGQQPQAQSQFNLSSPQPPNFNQQLNQLTNNFQNTSLQPQQPFNTGFQAQPQTSFGGFPQQQPQQPSFASFQAQPQTSFGFGQQQQPLEAQPTGFGFGNSSGSTQQFGQPQQQQFGQRANLANASADNPFGF